MRILNLTLIFLFLSQIIYAQDIAPTREFRGVWIASIGNIDFPSSSKLSDKEQKEEWIELMDYYKKMNFNAIIAQIRPAGDAFYPSKLNPWSKYLTGKQGSEPKYDPLQFMIEEAQKRGMEFHAWFNPYRASSDLDSSKLSALHPIHHRPEWFIQYGGKFYFNPGLPEVQEYITEVVGEVLMNYDVDGIHFDDYFYPYPVGGQSFNDSLTFKNYGLEFFNIENWRRDNVNDMIELVKTKIKTTSPHVKFGISPFGVWRNIDMDPVNGSNTKAGITTYDILYADVLKWLELGWIDYVVPQLYWNVGFPPADYEHLLDWWNQHTYDKHLYIGHAIYKIGNNKEVAWSEPSEIPNQIQMARDTEFVQGSVFYNNKTLQRNPLGVADSLEQNYFQYPAILPEMTYLELSRPNIPILDPIGWKNGEIQLCWRFTDRFNLPHYSIIYRFEAANPGDFNDPKNILAIVNSRNKSDWKYFDKNTETGKEYTYVITGVNRQHTQSDLSNWRAMKRTEKRFKKLK